MHRGSACAHGVSRQGLDNPDISGPQHSMETAAEGVNKTCRAKGTKMGDVTVDICNSDNDLTTRNQNEKYLHTSVWTMDM